MHDFVFHKLTIEWEGQDAKLTFGSHKAHPEIHVHSISNLSLSSDAPWDENVHVYDTQMFKDPHKELSFLLIRLHSGDLIRLKAKSIYFIQCSPDEFNKILFEEIAWLITNFSGYAKDNVTPDTSLNHHIKIDGDDAIEFLEQFAEDYSVDISNFQFDRYFESEGINPIHILLFPVFWLIKLKAKQRHFYVRDLVEAVIKGYLDK